MSCDRGDVSIHNRQKNKKKFVCFATLINF